MKKVSCIILVAILLSIVFFTGDLSRGEKNELECSSSEQYESGYRYNIQGWIYLHIEGEPYERGYQHGCLLSAEIVDTIIRWSNVIHNYPKLSRLTGDISSPQYEKVSQRWWNFCKTRVTKMYWNKYPEEYKQEIKGIADGVTGKGGKVFGEKITYQDILTINEMYEFMTKLENPKKVIHPLRAFFNSLKQLIPGLSKSDINTLISTFLNQPKTHHCSGFIASGDATSHGQIVATHVIQCGSWWYSYYIAQRWNVILDIQPTEGNRLLMVTSPGYIWSDENFYQNSNGIILLDTTVPQGLWKRTGLPFAIRTRKAAQYSNSIDDAIDHVTFKNDGIWTAVWLFGDTKTGEIARLDLGLYNHKLWRTYDGFYWSANNAMDLGVRFESNGFGLKGSVLKLLNIPAHGYYTLQYHPASRDKKFKEMGEKFYGTIDVDVLKEIMSTPPLFNPSTSDCKITDTALIENHGLWAFFGYLSGAERSVSDLTNTLKGIRNVPPMGWVLMYGLPSNYNYELAHHQSYDYGDEAKTLWKFTTNNENNIEYSHSTISESVLYSATTSGMIYALDAVNGNLLWEKNLSGNSDSTIAPMVYDDMVFIGSDNGLHALNKNDGEVQWSNTIGAVCSTPVFNDDIVIVGTKSGIHAFTSIEGSEIWEYTTGAPAYVSVPWHDTVFVGSDKECFAVDSESGEKKWVFEVDAPITSSPGVYKGTIYVGCWDGYLYALDAANGELKWNYKTGWGIDTTPAVKDDVVFFGSNDNNFYALDAEDGEGIWIFTTQASIHSSPVVYGKYVFFGSDDGRFYALDKTTGKQAWSFSPGYSLQGDIYNYITTPILSDSVVDDERVFIGIEGSIFALDAQTVEPAMVISEKQEISLTTWLFIIVPILILIGITFLYLYWIRKLKK